MRIARKYQSALNKVRREIKTDGTNGAFDMLDLTIVVFRAMLWKL
jgi:hypothetical protein